MIQFFEFEVLTTVTMKNTIFWDIADVYRYIGGTDCFHLQDRSDTKETTRKKQAVSRAEERHQPSSQNISRFFLVPLGKRRNSASTR
jgi:hypothetical protein